MLNPPPPIKIQRWLRPLPNPHPLFGAPALKHFKNNSLTGNSFQLVDH